MQKNIFFEKRTFSNGTDTLELLCEITCTGGSKIYSRVQSPEGRYYTPKFKEGEHIYITYRKNRWFMLPVSEQYSVVQVSA